MTKSQFLIELTVLILAIFVGLEVISKVPTLLHTPLMSGTERDPRHRHRRRDHRRRPARARSGGCGSSRLPAVALGTMNVVGGFVVTDRMLEMFKKRSPGGETRDEH